MPKCGSRAKVMRYGARKSFRIKLAEAPNDDQVATRQTPELVKPTGMAASKLGITVEGAGPPVSGGRDGVGWGRRTVRRDRRGR